VEPSSGFIRVPVEHRMSKEAGVGLGGVGQPSSGEGLREEPMVGGGGKQKVVKRGLLELRGC